MKRFLLAPLAALLLLLSACQHASVSERVAAGLQLPLEADVAFSYGEADGTAHLNVTETALTLGITDGALQGLVISVSDNTTRFLFKGMDVSFSANTVAHLRALRDAFLFLQTRSFDPKSAEQSVEYLEYTFPMDELVLTYRANKSDLLPHSVCLLGDGLTAEIRFLQ